MVRNYIRKTERVDYLPGHIVIAVREILLQNQTVTRVSLKFSIPRRSLLRYLKKTKEIDVFKLQFDISLGGYKKLEGECLLMYHSSFHIVIVYILSRFFLIHKKSYSSSI